MSVVSTVKAMNYISDVDKDLTEAEKALGRGDIALAQRWLVHAARDLQKLDSSESGPVAEFVAKAFVAICARI